LLLRRTVSSALPPRRGSCRDLPDLRTGEPDPLAGRVDVQQRECGEERERRQGNEERVRVQPFGPGGGGSPKSLHRLRVYFRKDRELFCKIYKVTCQHEKEPQMPKFCGAPKL
jgi:hypothetical protein